MFRSMWLTVFIVEYAVTSIINARNRHLRKRTTYHIINLTIIVMFLDNVFTACSLLHLTLLSLERLYATLFLIRHCLMLNWVYFKAVVWIWFLAVIPASASAAFFLIAPQGIKYVWASLIIAVCIWFLAVIPASAGAALYLIAPQASQYVWALLTIAVLFTVIVSYVIIALNLKRRVPSSYSSGAMSSERKLTVTMMVVIVLSTLAFLPFFWRCPCNNHKIARFIRWSPVWYPAVAQCLLLRQFLCKSFTLYLKNEGV